MKHYDAIVVGGGPAGITAALYLCRSGISVAQIEMLAPGGQILKTESIENYPGFPKGIKGWEMADAFAAHLDDYELDRYNDAVLKMEQVPGGWSFSVGKETIVGKAVVICSGANPRPLGVPRETELTGRGVSYCALCDGNFFRDKEVMVVGGGNTALEDALFLANLCRTVYLVHRRDSFRGEKVLAEAVAQRPNIRPLFNKTVESIHGGQSVEGAALLDTVTGERTQLPISAVFVAIGMQPDNGLFAAAGLDENGYIQADESCTTRLPGVFVAGDTRTKWLRQIITAAADGAVAATRAGHYLETAGLGQSEEALSPV